MPGTDRYEAIVIGTGAGGGTLAWQLARAGKRILILERGGFLPREKQNWNTKFVFLENRYHTKEVWTDKHGRDLHPGIGYYVDGNTKVYRAALFRLRKEDFGVLQHQGGISPAWPISYETLEPYYTRAEQLFQVHGKQGIDPTAGSRRRRARCCSVGLRACIYRCSRAKRDRALEACRRFAFLRATDNATLHRTLTLADEAFSAVV